MRQWSCPVRTGTLRFMVIDEQALSELGAEQLREVSQHLLAELRHQRALNEKLAYECALLKRLKFAAKSERHSAHREAATQARAAAGELAKARDPPRTHVHHLQHTRLRLPAQTHR